MGKHFIPQRYLKNFEDPNRPGFIWLHDKRSGTMRQVEIAEVAQSKGFYSTETERMLTHTVENPGNAVIKKLSARQLISNDERIQLAQYIGVMMKRVPASRRRAAEMAPAALQAVVSRIREQLGQLAKERRLDQELLSRRLFELDLSEKKFQLELPSEAKEVIDNPWPTLELLQLIFSMTWRILETSGPQLFITTDNPAFFFGAYGLRNPQAELSFPLSSTRALHGCWQSSGFDLVFLAANKNLAKEFNRRLASTAERLAFYHEPAPWILTILTKSKPYLSKIGW